MRFTLLIFCCTLYASAQKRLSLEEVWRLSGQHPALLQKAGEEMLAGIDQALTERLRLPVVHARYQSLLNLGRSIDPYTNTYDTRTLWGNTYGASLNYTLWDNRQIKNRISAAEFYYKALGMEKALAENEWKYRVLLAYTEILLVWEQIKMLEVQVNVTHENRNYLDKLYQAGRVRYAVLLSLEAELERLEAELRTAATEHDVARINLKRLIHRDAEPVALEVFPARYPFSGEQVLAAAYGQLPELKAGRYYRLQKKEEENRLFAERLPVISVFSHLGTTYSGAAMEMIRNEPRKMGYFKQLDHNLNMSLGVSVSVPVFNSVNFREKLQRNAIEQKILGHRENDLRQEIRGVIEEALARINGIAAQYTLSKERLVRLEALVQISKRSFEEGQGEFTAFLQARRDTEQARGQLSQLKYQYLRYFKQLEFYRKGVWE